MTNNTTPESGLGHSVQIGTTLSIGPTVDNNQVNLRFDVDTNPALLNGPLGDPIIAEVLTAEQLDDILRPNYLKEMSNSLVAEEVLLDKSLNEKTLQNAQRLQAIGSRKQRIGLALGTAGGALAVEGFYNLNNLGIAIPSFIGSAIFGMVGFNFTTVRPDDVANNARSEAIARTESERLGVVIAVRSAISDYLKARSDKPSVEGEASV